MSVQPQETARRVAESVLCATLEDIRVLLASDATFAGPTVGIITEDEGDIDTLIESAVLSLGTCCTVMLVAARDAKRSLPVVSFDSLAVIVEIAEKAVTNRAADGRTALELAELAARILHQAPISNNRRVTVDSIAKYAVPPKPADVCYHVQVRIGQTTLKPKPQELEASA
jgi:hypothetical protein